MQSLLPPNATELERLAAEALAQLQRVPVPLRELWNSDTCPAELLPYLAWAFSVDRWSSAWPERAKRDAIRAAYFIHAHKGTIGALRRVVEPLGYLIEVREWWEEGPLGVPGTFRLLVGVLDTGITEAMYQELTWLIDDAFFMTGSANLIDRSQCLPATPNSNLAELAILYELLGFANDGLFLKCTGT